MTVDRRRRCPTAVDGGNPRYNPRVKDVNYGRNARVTYIRIRNARVTAAVRTLL